jgi:hypothetical protein
MTKLETFLATLAPMQAAKARSTLKTSVRVNGGTFMTRAELIENRVDSGARVTVRSNGERVLMQGDGVFLDARNATATGLKYAEYLSTSNERSQ